MSRKGG